MDEKGPTPEEHASLVAQIERLRADMHRDLDAAIEALAERRASLTNCNCSG